MKVLIVGATGYVGTAVDVALSRNGHSTFGVARSDTARARLAARGTSIVLADAAKPQTLAKAAADVDAIVYAVNVTDDDPEIVDSNALRGIRKGLAGTEKTFVFVNAAWIYGQTGNVPATEAAPINPPPLAMRRVDLERQTLEMTRVGIRALIVRAGVAYGRGGGIPAMFAQSARASAARRRFSATAPTVGRRSTSTTSARSSARPSSRAARVAPTTPSTTTASPSGRSPKPRAAAPERAARSRFCRRRSWASTATASRSTK